MKAFATWLYEEGSKPENVLARLVLPRVPSKVIAEVLEGGAQQSRESAWAFLDKRWGQLIVRSKPGAQR
jgi:hypothetical protein